MGLVRGSKSLLLLAILAACGEARPIPMEDGGADGSFPEDAFVSDASAEGGADGSADADVAPVLTMAQASSLEGTVLSGVSVEVVGSAAEPVLTDDSGWAEVELPGPGTYLLRFSGDAVLTTVVAVDAEESALSPPSVELLPADGFALLEAALDFALNDALGIVRIRFEPAANGGQSATLASGGAFVHDESGAAVFGSTLLPDALPDVLFVDVSVGVAAPSVSTENPGEICELPGPPAGGWVVEAGAMTSIPATCRLTP